LHSVVIGKVPSLRSVGDAWVYAVGREERNGVSVLVVDETA
jgi:hypothetical protein